MTDRKLKIDRLNKNLDGITKKINAMVKQQRDIQSKVDSEISKMLIEENGITLADIQFSASRAKAWVGHFDNLAKYVNNGDDRKYCEFNGCIFLVEDVIEHNMVANYGKYEDLK